MPTRREPLAPWLVVAAVAVAGLATVSAGYLRAGVYVVAAAFVLAAVLRGLLPSRRAGALVVRARWLDVLMWAALGVVVAVGGWAVNIPPPGAP